VTTPTPDTRAQRLVLAGVMLVMGGVVFGGGTAIALHLVGMRPAAMAVAVVAGLMVVAGIAVQVAGAIKLKAGKT